MSVEHHETTGSCKTGHCDGHHHDHAAPPTVGLVFAIVAVVALIASWLMQLVPTLSSTLPPSAIKSGYWIAFFFGGFFALVDALKSLAKGKLTIDTLMIAAGVGAAFIGHLPEGALLLTLFSIGHAAEHYAMNRARRSIEALASMRPDNAMRIDLGTGETVEVPIDEIKVGDTVLVRPDARLPVDGIVISGFSSVDQSPITGESIPVDKSPITNPSQLPPNLSLVTKDNQVFAGTINGSGSMTIYVTRASNESTLARVVELIEEAKTQKSPTQRLTDSFEKRFVPAVLAVVALLLFAFLVIDEPFSRSLYRAMAVLVAASPCALAIATPSAVLSAIARAGRDGVLIKGGGPLELLGRVEAIAFDKTGTLTSGRPEVVDVVTTLGIQRRDLLTDVADVQRMSDHPLARAMVRASDAENSGASTDKTVSDFHRIHGQGVTAILDDKTFSIGNAKMFLSSSNPHGPMPKAIEDAVSQLMHDGRTIAIVAADNQYLGVIGMADTIRSGAKDVINKLRRLGMNRQIMLSGDHQNAVANIAGQLQLDEAHGDLLPEDKTRFIHRLSEDKVTAMVGDGANDAPAMAAASVSIAMGAAGSDVALETADVALMGDDLQKLPFAISLGQAANRIIRQNLFISLGTIVFLVPATLLGLCLGPAVVLHEGSTLVVVANALRLLAFRPPSS